MTMLITFTFNPNRESDFHMALALAKDHFPGAFKLGYSPYQINQRGIRITATSEEFCKWMHERDQLGFVNRMHQLAMQITYSRDHHFPTVDARMKASPMHEERKPRLEPLEYSTPNARGM